MTPPIAPPLTTALASPNKPIIRFDPSQRRFFEDQSRIIAVNWHRQKGKDFTAAAKAVKSAIDTRQSWYIVAMTQAQADETFAKCVKVAESYKLLLKRLYNSDELREEGESYTDYDREINHAFECTARILRLPGGGRVVSLPGKNPDTLAGRTGNLILTEFGLYPGGGYKHWEVLFPITTRGGFRLIVISTPRGRNTKFYEVCQNTEGFYSVHFCDIHKSVHEDGYQLFDAQGRPFPQSTKEERDLAIATFRRIYNSESKWPREYECQFTGDLSALIPWAELERAAELGRDLPFDYLRVDNEGRPLGDIWHVMKSEAANGAAVRLGWDVARTNNISAVTIDFCRPNRPNHLRFALGMKNLPFASQREFVNASMDLSWSSAGYGDATGMGRESNETLESKYGGAGGRWTPFLFTGPGKRDLASGLVTAFSDGTQTLPPMDKSYGGILGKFMATDIYAIQKDDTGGQMVLEETRNVLYPESHCDFAYAKGMGRLAASRSTDIPLPDPLMNKPRGW